MNLSPRWPWLLALGGCAQAALAFLIGVGLYPGGTMLDAHTRGYRFFENALSDLGRAQALSGAPNGALWIFNPALLVLGLCLWPFFRRLHDTLSLDGSRPRVWVILGSISPLGLAGVGLTPWDLALDGHNLALVCWLAPLAILLLWHTRAAARLSAPPPLASWPAAFLVGTLAIHLVEGAYLMTHYYLTGEHCPVPWVWNATVTTQKALALAFLVWIDYWAIVMLRRASASSAVS